MDQYTSLIVAVGVLLAVLVILLLLLRSRRQSVRLSDAAPLPKVREPAPDVAAPFAGPMDLATGVGLDDGSAEVMAMTGALVQPSAPAEGDPLTTIKGLGPKAATRLAELGVTRFDQIAGWSEQEARTIDAQMGPFQGRIARDRWIEQARLLAGGERARFEAEFGRIGG